MHHNEKIARTLINSANTSRVPIPYHKTKRNKLFSSIDWSIQEDLIINGNYSDQIVQEKVETILETEEQLITEENKETEEIDVETSPIPIESEPISDTNENVDHIEQNQHQIQALPFFGSPSEPNIAPIISNEPELPYHEPVVLQQSVEPNNDIEKSPNDNIISGIESNEQSKSIIPIKQPSTITASLSPPIFKKSLNAQSINPGLYSIQQPDIVLQNKTMLNPNVNCDKIDIILKRIVARISPSKMRCNQAVMKIIYLLKASQPETQYYIIKSFVNILLKNSREALDPNSPVIYSFSYVASHVFIIDYQWFLMFMNEIKINIPWFDPSFNPEEVPENGRGFTEEYKDRDRDTRIKAVVSQIAFVFGTLSYNHNLIFEYSIPWFKRLLDLPLRNDVDDPIIEFGSIVEIFLIFNFSIINEIYPEFIDSFKYIWENKLIFYFSSKIFNPYKTRINKMLSTCVYPLPTILEENAIEEEFEEEEEEDMK